MHAVRGQGKNVQMRAPGTFGAAIIRSAQIECRGVSHSLARSIVDTQIQDAIAVLHFYRVLMARNNKYSSLHYINQRRLLASRKL
jgi:hypothetical protein